MTTDTHTEHVQAPTGCDVIVLSWAFSYLGENEKRKRLNGAEEASWRIDLLIPEASPRIWDSEGNTPHQRTYSTSRAQITKSCTLIGCFCLHDALGSVRFIYLITSCLNIRSIISSCVWILEMCRACQICSGSESAPPPTRPPDAPGRRIERSEVLM